MSTIEEWIQRISKPQTVLSNHSVCPFARAARYKIVHTEIPDVGTFEPQVTLYVLPDGVSKQELLDMCISLNNQNPELVFLPDHKTANTVLNGVATGNGVHNIILAQERYELEQARSQLNRSNYYDHWDRDYLEEILGL